MTVGGGIEQRLGHLIESGQLNPHVAAPFAASAVSESESETRVGKRSGNGAGLPPKCHQDLTVSWAVCTRRPKAMTSFKRGVSDLGGASSEE
jgi:hypothetical protein